MRRSRTPSALLLVGLATGCVLGDVDLDGLECPCAAGWTCDEGRNVCVEDDERDLAMPEPDMARLDGGGEADGGEGDGGPTDGGPVDEGADAFSPFTPIADGASLRVDLGTLPTDGWPEIADPMGGMVGPVDTVEGDPTEVIFTAAGFEGVQEGGAASNDFGWPVSASQDTLWTGTFAGHAEAKAFRGTLTLSRLPAGSYEVVLFATRNGNDGGIFRLTRYTVDGMQQDLEATNNTSDRVVFSGARPDADGNLEIAVEVSPDGTARFAYLGLAVITREGP